MGSAVVIERAESNDSAYVPDLARVRGHGRAIQQDGETKIREAIAFHVEGLREVGDPATIQPAGLRSRWVAPAAVAR
jgi:predicted RNase H-like HicB family nuclease